MKLVLLSILLQITKILCQLQCNKFETNVLTGSVPNTTNTYPVCFCDLQLSCLRNCCPLDELMDQISCIDASGNRFKPKYVNESLNKGNPEDSMFSTAGKTCPKSLRSTDKRLGVLWLNAYSLNNGTILMQHSIMGYNWLFEPDEYCLQDFVYLDQEIYGPSAYLCYAKVTAASSEYLILYLVGIFISIISLILTLTTYIVLPELQNLHGKSIMCHTLSMLISFLALASIRIGKQEDDNFCVIFGAIKAASTLSAFFWLSVMGFDIWWKFSRHGYYGKPILNDEKKAFILYSIYSWGLPFFFLLFEWWMRATIVPKDTIPYWTVHLFNLGLWRCGNTEEVPTVVGHSFMPIAPLLIGNIVFYGLTTFNLHKLAKETTMARTNQRRNQLDRQRFVLHLKLFVIMGLYWLVDVIFQVMDGMRIRKVLDIHKEAFANFKYTTNIFNTCQGAFVFAIFVLKKDIKQKLWKKFCPIIHKEESSSQTSRKTEFSFVASNGAEVNGSWKPNSAL